MLNGTQSKVHRWRFKGQRLKVHINDCVMFEKRLM